LKGSDIAALTDVPFIESPDSIMVSDQTCGSQQYSAGCLFFRPGTRGHADEHRDQEELYYIFAGRGVVMIEDEAHQIEAGDVVFIVDGATHYPINDGARLWASAGP
jgi:mannose-6-phosphate isomerase-like protein (cupin superfamily)